MKLTSCELCASEAAVFCHSDAAFLCRNCDSKVHEANFIVARHFRQPICSKCSNFTAGESPEMCLSCPPVSSSGDLDSVSSSNSSTASPAKEYSTRRVTRTVDYLKAEDIFVNWSGKLGLAGDVAMVRVACGALRACLDRWKILPFRVCLAASMWLGLKAAMDEVKPVVMRKVMNRLEEISGVPAKVILATESKLERGLRAERRELDLEEGWAESA